MDYPQLLGAHKIHHSYLNQTFPDLNDYDTLILLGGPMSANDDAKLPWLKQEKIFIEKNIKAKKPIIGICLGAQLIASVLGAKISQNLNREIGWFELQRAPASEEPDPVFGQLPSSFLSFHWHGETFALPEGAKLLASSQACHNQAFVYENLIYALQFHPEVEGSFIRAACSHCPEDLEHGSYVQCEETMLAGLNDQITLSTNRLLLQNLLKQSESQASVRRSRD